MIWQNWLRVLRGTDAPRIGQGGRRQRPTRRYSQKTPSASSTPNFGVQSLQFRSGVVDFELPVDAELLGVGLVGPDPDLGLEQRQFADASVGQTLTAQTT